MEEDIRSKVIRILEETAVRKRDIAVYEYEFEFKVKIKYSEMLESIALEHGTGQAVGRVKGKVSDKTPEAALSYIERTDHANRGIAIEILDKLIPLDEEQRRLEAYLNLLDLSFRIFSSKQSNTPKVAKII